MRLDGHLEDFTLPDVLQLLAQTRKSGVLLLDTPPGDRQGIIRLGSGAVDGASSDLRRQALARRLVGSGLVGDEALEQAAADVRGGAPSLVRALIDRAGLAVEDIAAVAAEHATDAVCELLRWTSGAFSFRVGEPDPDALALGLSSADLVAEGERRMQVWPTLTSQIPSADSVLRLAAAPAFDPSCTREEWGLIALVDGQRSVSEIVALLGRSEFAVAGALAALVERGLLSVSAAGSQLADLQRRQAVIATLEGAPAGKPLPEAASQPARAVEPAASAAPVAPASPAAAALPAARDAEPARPVEVAAPRAASTGEAPSGSVGAPVTAGALALRPEVDPQPALPVNDAAQPSIRGLDSAVTKSLVLRLIAGVRGL